MPAGRLFGHSVSEETRKKLREFNLGKKRSEESIEKCRKANFGKKRSEESKHRMSLVQKGQRLGRVPWNKGKKGVQVCSEETRNLYRRQRGGDKNSNWRGGITSINKKIRYSMEYKLWRKSVFERDNWTCIWCGQVGGKLHADHIKPFSLYAELRLDINNGRTLCIVCHSKTDTYMGKIFLYKKQNAKITNKI